MTRRSFLRRLGTTLLALAAACLPAIALAQSALIDGQVIKVDEAARKITLRHGAFKKFDMDEPMTMVYAVRDPAMLKLVKAGDKVKFDAERINGQFTITVMQKVR